ncbi:hypothetical protein [Streptomyces cylindrosporus]|uniref:Uncharacterized protein n=1 Tax=Streptomyces cylindrosporus TaxID=2927583 RepID=A0ABS9YPJ4_9ACTN|nr:hypothetical protein [Streptomyces cylindrosporus]MCI3279192.1 hypothetical protein [Streptomyces cylindrosporus]
MPISRDDQQRVDNLHKAAAHLRETGKPELAETVEFVLTSDGRRFINNLAWKPREQEVPNLAMQMPETLRGDIKSKAARAGANLEAEAARALEEFVAGRFTPAQPVRSKPGETPKKVNLNVRVRADLRAQADEVGRQLLEEGELDWAPRSSHVIVAWFMDRVAEDFVNPIRKQQS